jgi:hypothetical protein
MAGKLSRNGNDQGYSQAGSNGRKGGHPDGQHVCLGSMKNLAEAFRAQADVLKKKKKKKK